MEKTTEKPTDITEVGSVSNVSSPDLESPSAVNLENKRGKPWSEHKKYLWVSFYCTLFTSMLVAYIAYISYVLSDGDEWIRHTVWTLLLLDLDRGIFRLIRPKKSKNPSGLKDRVKRHFNGAIAASLLILFSNTLARFFVNLTLKFFDLENGGPAHDICHSWDDPLGRRRCHMWLAARSFQLMAFLSSLVAAIVLRRAAIKRYGKGKIPMDPPPQVAAWKMGIIKELNKDADPTVEF